MSAVGFSVRRCLFEYQGTSAADQCPRCSLTIDVEDWYQSCVDLDAPITERVLRNMDRVRAFLDECGVKGTFFIQGRVARAFPGLLAELIEEGHEIQSHGYSHKSLYGMDRLALRTELEYARKSIEDACGVQVTAFRAPDFSIGKENLWALEVLAECGFKVDSSIFPVRMRRYGIAGWEREPHVIEFANGAHILEVPVAIFSWGMWRLPVAGGGYFRLLPKKVLKYALKTNIKKNIPAIIYCHPYEFNSRELADYRGIVPRRVLFLQGIGREAFKTRMKSLIEHFSFGRFDQVLEAWREKKAAC